MDLIAELRAALGDAQVLTGADAARKAQDPTGKYRWQPLALVRPADTVEVAAVLRLAGAAGAAHRAHHRPSSAPPSARRRPA